MREDSIRRARSNLRRRLMACDARYLLTLTTRDNVTEHQVTRDHLTRFLRKLRTAYPGIHYAGTPERQKRGAWHWHLGLSQRVDATLVRKLWRAVCGDGNIDLRHRTPLHVARYVAKYIGKDITGDLPGCTYVTSRGIPEPQTEEIDTDEPFEAFERCALGNPEWSGELLQLPNGRGWWAASWR